VKPRRFIGLIFYGVSGFFLPFVSVCGTPEDHPVIAIIIDDMGNQWGGGMKAINLPGRLTYSFLPFVSYSRSLARQAVKSGKEVMLHAPMQSLAGEPLGDGGLTLEMDQDVLKRQFSAQLAAIPNIAGINNHMGSALTQNPESMAWVMAVIRQVGESSLFFVDSLTTDFSVAKKVAEDFHVPALSRDVFLDHDESEQAVRNQFDKLIAIAKQRGYALAIGHPRTNTLKVLGEKLAELDHYGVKLVPVSKLVDMQARMAETPEPEEVVHAELSAVDGERLNEFELF